MVIRQSNDVTKVESFFDKLGVKLKKQWYRFRKAENDSNVSNGAGL